MKITADIPVAQPSVFVPHGAPTFALRPGAAGAAMAQYAQSLLSPRAIIVVSAHFTTQIPVVGTAAQPQTVHDYQGFPAELYRLNYPASGCAEASQEVAQCLAQAGLPVALSANQGLDHGAWIPLRLMFPHADVPVIPLSIQTHLNATHHFALGQALAPLSQRGFLVLASGNLTHNLYDYMDVSRNGKPVPLYVREFADWIWDRIQAGDTESLLDYRKRAPGAVQAHPHDDHLLPFFVALGARPQGGAVSRLHAGIDDYVLAMDSFAFHAPESVV